MEFKVLTRRGEADESIAHTRRDKQDWIAYFLLELQALAFVLILEFVLLDLNALQGLDALFDFGWEAFDVSRALSKEIRKTILNQSQHRGLGTGREGGIAIIFLLIILGDVWHRGTRQSLSNGCLIQGGVLGCRSSDIAMGNGQIGRHDGDREKKIDARTILVNNQLKPRRQRKTKRSFGLRRKPITSTPNIAYLHTYQAC